MSEAGIKWFISIADKLNLSEKEQLQLLDVRKKEIIIGWKNNPELIPPETITRLSYLVGIYKDLNILFKPDTVLEWLRNVNSNQLFNGLSPLQYMMEEGISNLSNVRIYLSDNIDMDESINLSNIIKVNDKVLSEFETAIKATVKDNPALKALLSKPAPWE